MKGCLVPLIGGLGALLMLPGLCFLSVGSLAGPTNPGGLLMGVALGLIAVAVLLAVLWKGD